MITPILTFLNILVFAIMAFYWGLGTFLDKDLLVWGANTRPLTLSGEYWRLFSHLFIHQNILHLGMNMYSLLLVGLLLESFLGKWKFLGIYLLTGILAACGSMAWNETIINIGTTGAIFGLFGVFSALCYKKVFTDFMDNMIIGQVILLVFSGYPIISNLIAGIDNSFYISGFVSGFGIGILLYYWGNKERN